MASEITFPCKMYKLGDAPINVSAEVDAERHKKEGWTFTPQKYEFKDLPRVIYHPVQGNKIVTTEDELESALKDGWSRSPFNTSEVESLRKQIEFHTAQAVKLRVRLQEINPSETDDEDDDEDEPEAKSVLENVRSSKEVKPEISSKKRGRPSKKAV